MPWVSGGRMKQRERSPRGGRHQSIMMNLLRAEWLKLSRRPMAWVLLAIFLALMLLYFVSLFLVVALNDGTFTGGATRIQVLREEQITQYRRQLSFPGVFGATLGQVNSIGGICAIILAAGVLGSEYSWGTLRLHLARHPRRGLYLTAKSIALLALLFVGIAIAVGVGALCGLLFGTLLGDTGSIGVRDLLVLPVGMLRALYVMLPYVMFTIACCTLGRSVLAGVAGGLLFLTLDVSAGALSFLAEMRGPLAFAYNLFVQQNITTLVVLNSRSFGLDPTILMGTLDVDTLPSPLQATLVVALYSALFFASAHRWLARRDITGAA